MPAIVPGGLPSATRRLGHSSQKKGLPRHTLICNVSPMLTVATFSKPEEAHMLRLRLEAGGVPAYIQDENMVQMEWLYSNAIGGVRVQIHEDDAERAKEIFLDSGILAETTGMPGCPRCSATNTAPDELPRRLSFLSMMLIGMPFLFSKTRWRCADCTHVWNEKNREARQ